MEKDLSSRQSFGKASEHEDQKLKEQIEGKEPAIKMPDTEWDRSLKVRIKRLKPSAKEVVAELDRSFKENMAEKENEHHNNRRENFKKAKKIMALRTPEFGFRKGRGQKIRKRGQYLNDQAEQHVTRNEKNELLKIKQHYRNNIERVLSREGFTVEQAKDRENGDSNKDTYNLSSPKTAYLIEKFESRARESQGRELEK